MAWFLNFYRCDRCGRRWTDEWSCTCDDECPHCGARDMTPFDSENLTGLIEQDGKEFVAIRSPDSAEHDPDYREVGRFPTREAPRSFWLRLKPPDLSLLICTACAPEQKFSFAFNKTA